MFGSEYSKHPEMLMGSFQEMKHEYKGKINKKNSFLSFLQKYYLKLMGIPEIGFQVRSLHFKDIILEEIKKIKISKILDAGSGIGAYSIYLSRQFPQASIYGWEIDKSKLDFSEKFCKELKVSNCKFIYKDITDSVKKEEIFNLIVSIDVLEHIESYKKVLKNFFNLLSPGGYLYIHTPQPNQKRIFKQLINWQHEDHVREGFSPKLLKKDFLELGFRIIKIRETFGFFGKLSWELNHILLSKNFMLAGVAYPLLLLIMQLDLYTRNSDGLGIAMLVQKKNN